MPRSSLRSVLGVPIPRPPTLYNINDSSTDSNGHIDNYARPDDREK